MRWLIVFVIASLVFSRFSDWLRKVGLGRLPGDFSFRWRGRNYNVPLASSLLLSFFVMLVSALV